MPSGISEVFDLPLGNEINTYLVSIGAEQQVLNLHQGWNLISIRLDTGNIQEPSLVLEPIKEDCVAVWAYDADLRIWKRYVPDGPGSLNTLNAIEPGKGYLIYMKNAAILTITGVPIANTDIQLYEGWNLVGYNSSRIQSRGDALSTIADYYDSIWTYDNTARIWLGYIKIKDASDFPNTLTQLEPGKGYWIYVNQNPIWTLSP